MCKINFPHINLQDTISEDRGKIKQEGEQAVKEIWWQGAPQGEKR